MFATRTGIRLAVAMLAALLASGCTQEFWYVGNVDEAGAALEAPSDKANIYVARADDLALPGLVLVSLDGEARADLQPLRHLLFQEAPGERTVGVQSLESADRVTLQTEAGKSYFVLIDARWGSAAPRPHLRIAGDVEGRRQIVYTTPGTELPYKP